MIQFCAHFDGQYLLPDEPVSLPENVPLRIMVEESAPTAVQASGPFDLFERLEIEVCLIDGPVDRAVEHDHYLFSHLAARQLLNLSF